MVNFKLSREDVLSRADSLDLPDSVLDYFEGLMGEPFDGFPEPLRTQVLARAGRAKIEGHASARLKPIDLDGVWQRLKAKHGDWVTETDLCSYLMFPDVFAQYSAYLTRYGDISQLPSQHVLAPPRMGEEIEYPVAGGRSLRVQLVAVQPPSDLEDASPERTVFFRVNGRYRQTTVRDLSCKSL
jgi:pyruvate carboxylase